MSENEIPGVPTTFTPIQDGTKLHQLSIGGNILSEVKTSYLTLANLTPKR